MSDEPDNTTPETASSDASHDTQDNHDAETEEDTASGGAAEEPSPKDL